MVIPFHFYKDYIWGIYAFGVLSLLFLHFSPFESLTPIINGAKSWYQFGFFSIQPSEFMKIIYIMALAYVISQHNKYKIRSEEHTSELQSRFDLVCRLLLEKK